MERHFVITRESPRHMQETLGLEVENALVGDNRGILAIIVTSK